VSNILYWFLLCKTVFVAGHFRIGQIGHFSQLLLKNSRLNYSEKRRKTICYFVSAGLSENGRFNYRKERFFRTRFFSCQNGPKMEILDILKNIKKH